ncbi:MAG: 30S ribosomal protein S16 [Acidobacteria bacterium]|nr:30S ribosomal protein S16 [Acidobacteriota bacterium]
MLKIRLRREGSKNHPFFRVVVSDSRNTPTGPTVDIIGYYNPKKDPAVFDVDYERYDDWVRKGAHPSDTVKALVGTRRAAAQKAAV